ncbi:MAG: RNA polymerase sigma factor [Oligoflexales bacterium]
MSDEEQWKSLMIQAQLGNQEAYRNLLKELSLAMKKFISQKVGNLCSVDDILQEFLISLHNSLATYDPSRPFKSWVYTIARYKIIDHLRKGHTHVELSDDFKDNKNEYKAFENNDMIQKALKKLSPSYREPIILTKINGFSVKEAAEKLNLSESALKVRCSRGIKDLKDILTRIIHEE